MARVAGCCHPERSRARFLRPRESKDLRLYFGSYTTSYRLTTLDPTVRELQIKQLS
jgi:hypothetical protein